MNNGDYLFSGEIAKTTQLARVYRFMNGQNWESIAESQGYAYKCYPTANSTYCIDGRFGAFILEPNGKRVHVPLYDQNYGNQDLRVPAVAVAESVVYQVKTQNGISTLQYWNMSEVPSTPNSSSFVDF